MRNRISSSGLFELFAEVVVEGDCCTPSRVFYYRVGVYPTSEALERGVEAEQARGLMYFEIRYPQAYLNRMQKLQAIQDAKRSLEALSSEIPF